MSTTLLVLANWCHQWLNVNYVHRHFVTMCLFFVDGLNMHTVDYFAGFLVWLQQMSFLSMNKMMLTSFGECFWAITFGHTELNMSYYVLKNQSYIVTLGNPFKIAINHRLINSRKNFFSEWVAGVWKSLSHIILLIFLHHGNLKLLQHWKR